MAGVTLDLQTPKYPILNWGCGDSQTSGLLSNGSGTTLGWVKYLPRTVPSQNLAHVNWQTYQLGQNMFGNYVSPTNTAVGSVWAMVTAHPQRIISMSGVNDIGTGGATAAQVQEQWAIWFNQLDAHGVDWRAMTIIPYHPPTNITTGSGLANDTVRLAANTLLRNTWGVVGGSSGSGGSISTAVGTIVVAAGQNRVIDLEPVLKDSGTGLLNAGFGYGDGLHPSQIGEQAIATAVAPYMVTG